jgi:two-component system response regulator
MQISEVEILLVEDDDADMELTLNALRTAHVANPIHIARDGQETLDFFAAHRAQGGPNRLRLVLLDLKMPRVDGLTVLREIRKDAQWSGIPVVVLTSSAQDPDLRAAYALGANSYIQKPPDFEQFRNVVAKVGLYWLVVNRVPQNGSGVSEAAA